jgi:hypothetical protein
MEVTRELECMKEFGAEVAQQMRDLRAKLASGVDKTVYDVFAPLPPDIRFCAGDLVADDLPLTCDCLIVAGNLKVKLKFQPIFSFDFPEALAITGFQRFLGIFALQNVVTK